MDMQIYMNVFVMFYVIKHLYLVSTIKFSKISLKKKIQKRFEYTDGGQIRFAEGSVYKAASWQRLFQGQPEAAEPWALCPPVSLDHHSIENQSLLFSKTPLGCVGWRGISANVLKARKLWLRSYWSCQPGWSGLNQASGDGTRNEIRCEMNLGDRSIAGEGGRREEKDEMCDFQAAASGALGREPWDH